MEVKKDKTKVSLAEAFSEIAKEWHPTMNGELTPEMVTPGSGKKVWWLGKCGHKWQTRVADRASGRGCPYCAGKKVLSGYNDLTTTHPDIAKQWYPTKNRALSPKMVSAGSNKKIWWQCEHGHKWKTTVASRTAGNNCPYCAKNGTSRPELTLLYYIQKHISPDAIHRYRDLGFEIDIYIPELCIGIEHDGYVHLGKEIEDITKNKKCLENDIKLYRIRDDKLSELNDSSIDYFYKYGNDTAFSDIISKLLSDISETEIKVNTTKDFAEINNFIKYVKIENSLAETHPDIAKEWHPTKNGSLSPEMVPPSSKEKVWWKCKYGHEWETTINHRTKGTRCPYCSGRQPILGKTDLATKYPQLSKEWHPTKNGTLTSEMVMPKSNKKVWWKCDSGHEWQATIASRVNGAGCPYCTGRYPILGVTDLATTHPEIAVEWNYAMNGDLTPEMISAGSGKKVWWQCSHCDNDYQRRIIDQTKKDSTPRCPHCKTPVNIAKSA